MNMYIDYLKIFNYLQVFERLFYHIFFVQNKSNSQLVTIIVDKRYALVVSQCSIKIF